MSSVSHWRTELLDCPRSGWPEYLDAHSGLPGPRGNLELAAAFAELADDAMVDELAGSDDEYRACCAAIALGPRAADPAVAARLRTLADDERWRVREGVATGLQRLGDVAPERLTAIVLGWVDDSNPLVQRAAAATICEPRLLLDPSVAAVAVRVCDRATASLARRPVDTRRDPHVRTLRQALGYCWSVAIAADPEPGLTAFGRLDRTDGDVAWIVEQNLRKRRLARLLA